MAPLGGINVIALARFTSRMTPETNAHTAIRLRIHQFILNSPKPCQRAVTRSRLQPSAKHARYRDRGRKSTRSQFAQFISFPSSAFLSLSDRAERNSAGNAPCLYGGAALVGLPAAADDCIPRRAEF
jgi:hypothetical protein